MNTPLPLSQTYPLGDGLPFSSLSVLKYCISGISVSLNSKVTLIK